MNRWMPILFLVGCATEGDLLPLLDGDGTMVGVYDPSIGSIEVGLDGDAVESPDGSLVDLVEGAATLDEELAPGDAVIVLDGARATPLTVGDADASQDGRFGACTASR
ncbi:MAG: hypothetical protein ABMA64_17795 [Myxococcota bacterium]